MNPTPVALFVRVSSKEQDYARQVHELTDLAAQLNLHVVEVIQEKLSGSTKNEDRPAIQRLLQLARERKIKKVLVHEVTRLGRSTAEVLKTLEDLHAQKVSVYIKTFSIETLTPEGKVNHIAQMLVTLLAEVGRMEKAILMERIESGRAEARRKGTHMGRPAGTTKEAEDLLTEYSTVVAMIRQGKSIRDIAARAQVSPTTVQKVKRLLTPAA